MLQIIHLTVNGRAQELAVDIRASLADVLRRQLGLTSVKKGCEVGECGACTVLIDGRAVDSCLYPFGRMAARSLPWKACAPATAACIPCSGLSLKKPLCNAASVRRASS